MDFRRPALAVTLLLVLAGLGTLWLRARNSAGMDFYQMWIGARMARETMDFYAPATRARMGEFYLREAVEQGGSRRQVAVAQYRRDLELVGTPLLYTVYSVLPRDYERAFFVFHIAVFAAFAGWVVIFARLFSYDSLLTLLLLGFLVTAAEPARSDATVGNVNHVMVLLVALAAFATVRRRFATAGAILAVATLIRPYVILTIPLTWLFWIIRRRWHDLGRHAAGAFIASLLAIIATIFYFADGDIWIDWLEAFRTMPGSMIPIDIGNMALSALSRPASIVLFLAAAAAVVFVALRRTADDVLPVALACVLFQLISPLVWVHHLLLSMPLILWLLRPASPRPAQIGGAVALALIAVEPWGTFVPTVEWVAAGVNAGLLIAIASVSLSRAEERDP